MQIVHTHTHTHMIKLKFDEDQMKTKGNLLYIHMVGPIGYVARIFALAEAYARWLRRRGQGGGDGW